MRCHLRSITSNRFLGTFLVLISLNILSCKNGQKEEMDAVESENPSLISQPSTEPNVILSSQIDLGELESSFMKWWNYHADNISLNTNFIGIDQDSTEIDSNQFLDKLATGKFIPLKIKSVDGTDWYQLRELSMNANQDIGKTIKNEAQDLLKKQRLVKTLFPEFDFIDIKGTHFTNGNTAGKTLIIKTWFINCVACVAEFPELNAFVEKNENSQDFIFLSLATDSKEELQKFLARKEFKYKVIPDQKSFILNELKSNSYPTHFIINKNGEIEKITNKASEMISYLEGNKISMTR
ncbi:TlpA family protein disulfide reductase [Flagellimonas pelagia]|uniref:TlpA family protein disulfide reductase n=2 Tax=Flagellimonas pelagia TaxID=2306998 RepID=A0A3A1NLN0_9FLAO|nr:TlpA family protein disulfide reductase [Allomuricauda maritima]TXK00925.1 TlpA family protein disulfide reductase [Allomuricauda maritima]